MKIFTLLCHLGLFLTSTAFADMSTLEKYRLELRLARESLTPELPQLKVPKQAHGSPRSNKYAHIDPDKLVNAQLLETALKYFEANQAGFENRDYLTVIDFSVSSTSARFSLINMNSGAVIQIHVAHGEGSDPDDDGIATKFSNLGGTHMSSLGVYNTAETYTGTYGYSLRIDGLSATNSNARKRAIVVHGADYVNETDSIQGRSLGCPALALKHRDEVIAKIKSGSMIFAGN